MCVAEVAVLPDMRMLCPQDIIERKCTGQCYGDTSDLTFDDTCSML